MRKLIEKWGRMMGMYDEQWSYLEKPKLEEIPSELQAYFEKTSVNRKKNWGL